MGKEAGAGRRISGAHSFVEGSEEVDLLCEGIQPGLQLCLVQVGSVHLLGEETHPQNEVSFREAEETLEKGFLSGLGGTHLLQGHEVALNGRTLVQLLFISGMEVEGWSRLVLNLKTSRFQEQSLVFLVCTVLYFGLIAL